MSQIDSPSRFLLVSALLLTSFVGGALGQEIVVRHVQGGGQVENTASQEVEFEFVHASGRQSEGKRIQLIVEARVNTQDWEARLTNKDIDAREMAFDELLVRARKDTSLGLALKSWSLDPSKPELAWSARLALRELEQRNRPMAFAWVPRGGMQHGGMMEAVAAQPGVDVQEIQELPVPQQLRSLDPGGLTPLEDRRMLSLSAPRIFGMLGNPGGPPQHQRRFKLEFQREGVTLVVTEFHHGQVSERVYAAGSIESLLAAHPELRGQVPALANINTHQLALELQTGAGPHGSPGSLLGPESGGSLLHQGFVRRVGGASPERISTPMPTGQILGVKCTPLSMSEAEQRLLGPGVGLLIERREPGSIAEALELQRGDILVELFGQQLCSPEEISRLLQENVGREIKVKFVDRDGLERVRTWAPAPAQKP